MAFPDLQPYASPPSVYHTEAVGVPDNGNNTFRHNIPVRIIKDHLDGLEFHVYSESSDVTNATLIGLSPDLSEAIINFTQAGAGQARVRAIFLHSIPY